MDPISFRLDITPLFRNGDIRCMGRFDVFLDDYVWMSNPAGNQKYDDYANARHVLCFLSPDGCEPRMPKGGPYWNEVQLDIYAQWMIDGFAP